MGHRLTRLLGSFVALGLCAWASATVQWVGNTRLFMSGHPLPLRGAYVEAFQAVTVTSETWPIAPGQRVVAVVSHDGFASRHEVQLTWDGNVGANSRWFAILGPYPRGVRVDFYIRAEGAQSSVRWDSNGTVNFGFLSRHAPRFRNSAILQWFETDYRTMLRRLPEVVRAGYGAIYLPPPSKAGGGGLSVGFNVFDRFDLGDRLKGGTVRTRYGTTQELLELIRTAERLGLEVYADLVPNHNDNRATTPIDRYPDLIPEDFHIRSSTDTGNSEINFNVEGPFTFGMLNHELFGLVDIAHEDGNNTRTGPFVLPPFATFNTWGKPSFVRHPLTPQYYPGASGPYPEDVRQYLKRWMRWLVETVGFDGFRVDAVKHTPPGFFGWAPDQPPGDSIAEGDALPFLYWLDPSLYIFGETYSDNAWELREYAKTGMNLLDFPLKFTMGGVFNSGGFGNIGAALANGFGLNAQTGLPFERGGLGFDVGVSFAQSHDDGPPQADNLAHAFALTRPARAKVYYDGNNVQPGNWGHFPRPGRADALGSGGNTLLRILDARNRFGRGAMVNRVVEASLYVYERQVNGAGLLLVGVNIRGDEAPLTRTVQTAFEPGTTLVDLGGQRPDVTVGADRRVTITVPSNHSATQPNNGRGFVLYAPRTPRALPGIEPIQIAAAGSLERTTSQPVTFVTETLPAGAWGQPQSYRAAVVSAERANVRVQVESTAREVWLKLNNGLPLAGRAPGAGTPEGLTDGYVRMDDLGEGSFVLQNIDLWGLDDGLHVLRARAFLDTGARPGLFSDFTLFLHVRRGLGGARVIDGQLSDAGTPLAVQTARPSSNSNRADALFVSNDDRFVYLGVAGRVDASEWLTNGIVAFLDADPGAGTGLRDFSALNDDSGPLARLASNTRTVAPAGFGAESVVGSFRHAQLHSAPGMSFLGELATTKGIGAQAGLFNIDPARPNWMRPQRALVAFAPRLSPSEPWRGLEAALPIEALFPNGVPENAQIGVVVSLNSTGETGTTLAASDPLRGVLGGRPEARAWVSNQFLPSIGTTVPDPGTSPVNLTSSATFTMAFAATPAEVQVRATGVKQDPATGELLQWVTVRNAGTATLTGPVHLLVQPAAGFTVTNAVATSSRAPRRPYLTIATRGLAPGASVRFLVRFAGPGSNPAATFQVRTGRGVL
jgi:alpha-amylase